MMGSPTARGTLGYLLRRLGWAAILVAGVTTLSFFVAQVLPGDPARMLAGAQASAKDVQRVREIYGLDRPMVVQYGLFWRRLVHSGPDPIDKKRDKAHASCTAAGLGLHIDLGYSYVHHKPVTELLRAKIPASAELAAAALTIQLLLGITLGALAAARRGTRWDDATIGATLVGASAPTFLTGLVLQYVLAYRLHLLPYDGYGATPAEHLRSLLLPALTLGIFGTAFYTRIARDELSSLLSQDFIRTVRAKGASGARVLFAHALRNALVPIATLAALDLGTMVGGAIVTETLFRWPGVGQMTVSALQNRDGPVIVGTVIFASMAVVASTLALDLLYVLLDPRLRSTGPADR